MSTSITPKMAADILGGVQSWRITDSQVTTGDMFINGEISVEAEFDKDGDYWTVRVTIPVTGPERELTFTTLYEPDWSDPEDAKWSFDTDGDRIVVRVVNTFGEGTVFTHHSMIPA